MIDLSQIALPKSVQLRPFQQSVSVMISFYYQGVRIRETLFNRELPHEPTAAAISQYERQLRKDVSVAGHLLNRIRDEIAQDMFDLAYHFPQSTSLKKLGIARHQPEDVTVKAYLERFLERAKHNTKTVTWEKYSLIFHGQLIPSFGHLPVERLTAGMIRDWVHKKSLKNCRKTINNILSPFRVALDDAVMDDVITQNPVRKIRLNSIIAASARKNDYKPDPFSAEERERLLAAMTGQVRNIFQFAFYTGLRTSELLGLTWEKVDLKARIVLVDQAVVDGELGPLKTAGKGVESRKVLLLDPAMEALQNQRAFTQLTTPMADGFVFHNPRTNKPWDSDEPLRRLGWKPAFKASGVRYRNPYQTRHTYAHIMIRQSENMWWIANQMGHTGIEMLNRHYGGWLEDCGKRYQPKALFTVEEALEVEEATG